MIDRLGNPFSALMFCTFSAVGTGKQRDGGKEGGREREGGRGGREGREGGRKEGREDWGDRRGDKGKGVLQVHSRFYFLLD